MVGNQERKVFGDGDRLRFSLAVDDIFHGLFGLFNGVWRSCKLDLVQAGNIGDSGVKLLVDVLEEGFSFGGVLVDPFVPHLGLRDRKVDFRLNNGGDLLVDPLGKVFDLGALCCHNDLGR